MCSRTLAFSLLSTLLTVAPLSSMAQDAPAEETASAHSQHIRGTNTLYLANAEGAQITYWAPDLSITPVEVKNGAINLPQTGVDNYHALVIDQDWGAYRESLVQYFYKHGKPSKQSPTRILAAEKTPLEIVPDPLPREHHRYFTQQEAGFVVRFKGIPLAEHPLLLETENGTVTAYTTDLLGRVIVPIPDDFPNVVSGERDRRRADFMLTTNHNQDGVSYRSALNMDYSISHSHWQFTNIGFAVAGVGLLFGGFIGRVKTVRRTKA